MCGIAGVVNLRGEPVSRLRHSLHLMNSLQEHRGPDGAGTWTNEIGSVGLAHRRLSIIDLECGAQPMQDARGDCITFNGEIYNFVELRDELGSQRFRTSSDTEVILHAHATHGDRCVDHLRGMFAFAVWNDRDRRLFAARDRFGIKPFYYTIVGDEFYFASEVKALLPFIPDVAPDPVAMRQYLTFQFPLDGRTLFANVHELPPAHTLEIVDGNVRIRRYWELEYEPDFDHSEQYFTRRIRERIEESLRLHLRSDVPVGAYLSGGIDSSIVSALAANENPAEFAAYTGKFTDRPGFDESDYARALCESYDVRHEQIAMTHDDFVGCIEKIAYHMDYPVAGPGAFPQYLVSELASRGHSVVLGGQGGDEVFGGYMRYLVAYFEQCIKGAIDGTGHDGNFVVTYESIIPNLGALRSYKPMLKQFWSRGLFDSPDRRYFQLVDRSGGYDDEIRWEALGDYDPWDSFSRVFNAPNARTGSYFDQMTHFDLKTLLPALLQVEDRVSMAHGLESRVPFLDHLLVEEVSRIPSVVKFKNGTQKKLLVNACRDLLPPAIANRTDKMGFPVPLNQWFNGPLSDFLQDILRSDAARTREFVDNTRVAESVVSEGTFGRKIWGLLQVELWYRTFVDEAARFRAMRESDLAA